MAEKAADQAEAPDKAKEEPTVEAEAKAEAKAEEPEESNSQRAKEASGRLGRKLHAWAAGYRGFNDQVDASLGWARRVFPPERYELFSSWSVMYGHVGLLVAQILALVFGIIASIKLGNGVYIIQALGIVLLLTILQYTAEKFMGAGSALLKSSPSRVGSAAFLDCFALLAEIIGILLFVRMMFAAQMTGQWGFFWVGLAFWALFDGLACVSLHPDMVNVTVAEDVKAGEEAIGILSFVVKACVRVVPIAFGAGAVLGSVGLLFGIFSLIGSGERLAGTASLRLVATFALLPFLAYIGFAAYHLVIDVLGAILALPRKLDKIAGRS